MFTCFVYICIAYCYFVAKEFTLEFETISVYMPLIGFDIARQIIWLLLLAVCVLPNPNWLTFFPSLSVSFAFEALKAQHHVDDSDYKKNRDREATCFTRNNLFDFALAHIFIEKICAQEFTMNYIMCKEQKMNCMRNAIY